jgi:hypothetical protein
VAHAARHRHRQLDRGAGLAANALPDDAVADLDAVDVNHDLGRHDQHDVPVAGRDRQVEGRLADDGGGEVDDHVAVPRLHQQAARHHPVPVPLDGPVPDLQLHQVLGRCGRGQPGAGRSRQVGQQKLELPVRARGQRGAEALVEFVGGEPTVPGRDPQLLRDLVAVLV